MGFAIILFKKKKLNRLPKEEELFKFLNLEHSRLLSENSLFILENMRLIYFYINLMKI